MLITRALNIPVDVCHVKTECKSLVVQVLGRGRINHAKHRVAASTDQIHDQTAEGKLKKKAEPFSPNHRGQI